MSAFLLAPTYGWPEAPAGEFAVPSLALLPYIDVLAIVYGRCPISGFVLMAVWEQPGYKQKGPYWRPFAPSPSTPLFRVIDVSALKEHHRVPQESIPPAYAHLFNA